MNKKFSVALVGATGLVGKTFLHVLEERKIPIKKLVCYASERSEGKAIKFNKKDIKATLLCEKNVKKQKFDFAFFAISEKLAKEFAPVFVKTGAIVIDNSSAHRMIPNIPLVVPEVNFDDVKDSDKLIANPNCSTIQCMLPLKALHDEFQLKNISFTTFQAVSGSGTVGVEDLERTSKGEKPQFYPYPIYNNCLPHIGDFLPSGFTKEEEKMIYETQKILHLPYVPVSATCVRVPIANSHSISISATFEQEVDVIKAKECLSKFENLILEDDTEKNFYPIATKATGRDEVFIGRVRKDIFDPHTIHMFCVSDNVRKGAATNGVQIMEKIIIEFFK